MKTDIATITQLSSCLLNLKKYQEAENLLKKLIHNGNSPELYYYLGLSFALQGKYNEAIDALTIHLSSIPDTQAARELIFRLLINKAQLALEDTDYCVLSDILTDALHYLPNREEYKKILSHFEGILPVSFIKNGEREKAAKIWIDKLMQSSFSETETIHNLAFLYYWWAISNEQEILKEQDSTDVKKRDFADYLWTRTFMYWFSFVNSQDYWEKICANRSNAWKSVVTPDEINTLKSEITENKLLKILEQFQDNYRQSVLIADFDRIRTYIINYFFEKQTTKYWMEFHELMKNNYESLESDFSNKANEISKLKGPFPLSFINEYFKNIILPEDMIAIISSIKKTDKDNEILENIRLFYISPVYGKIVIVINELKDIEYATKLCEEIKDNENKEQNKKSVEEQYLLALIHFEKGNHFINEQEVSDAFKEWANANSSIKKIIDKDENFKILIKNLQKKLFQTASDECIRYAKKLNVAKKVDEAIEILETGFNITGDNLIKNLLCANYCDKAHLFLKTKKFNAANKLFEKALEIDKKYSAALKGMSISKNNEGLETLDDKKFDKAITLLQEAYNFDKDDVVKNNLASAYNQKAVNILNGSSYYQYNTAIELLEKGLKLLNSELDVGLTTNFFMLTEEWEYNNFVKNIKESLYKTMLYNLWVAARNKHNLLRY